MLKSYSQFLFVFLRSRTITNLLTKITFIAAISLSALVHAQGISEVVCDSHERTMEVIFSWREQSIPIQYAKEAFDHEDNFELRFWLRNVVTKAYKNPAEGRAFVESGVFVKECLEIHRGF